nr:hypothetical protein [Halohasta salina]
MGILALQGGEDVKTYSSFSVRTVRLWEDGMRGYAVLNALGNLALSAAAVGVAWLLVA